MCGRFTLQIPPELIAEIFGLAEVPVYPARYNIAPTQKVAVIRQDAEHHNRIDFIKWGLIPSWSKDPKRVASHMINVRSESIAEKPAFRTAIRYRRCLIPSNAFYEWREEGGKKVPHYVHMKNGSPIVFAGIWDHWKTPDTGETVETCSILTTASNKLIEPLHERMPVILHPGEYDLWLDRDMNDPEKLKTLYRPYPPELMEMYPVSPLVNIVKNDSPDLIEPTEEIIH